jgi:hypothetical protein
MHKVMESRYTSAETEELFKGKRLTYEEARKLNFEFISGRNAEFRTPEGKLIAKLVTGVFDECENAERHAIWKQVKDEPRNRPEIFGRGARQPLLKKNGELTAFVGVPTSLTKASGGRAGMLGPYRYHGRGDGGPLCDLSGWTKERVDLYTALIPSAVSVSDMYKYYLPTEFAEQEKYISQILPGFKIPGTNFTTVYGIKNHPTAVHRDTFDIPTATGVLTTTGDFEGNEFCLPEYGLAFDLQPSDILFADVHLWHGNLPRRSGQRVAQVYFVRKDMHECGRESKATEITGKAIAQTNKTV